jgi:tetratricopeptide (TPR) repeat protein
MIAEHENALSQGLPAPGLGGWNKKATFSRSNVETNRGENEHRPMKLPIQVLVVSALFLFSSGALAKNVFISEAKDQLVNLRYENALKTLGAALKKPNNTRQDLLDIYRLRGVCLASMGQNEQAIEAFARFLSIEPAYSYPNKTSPRLTAPLEQARKRIGGGIRVKLEPVVPEEKRNAFSFELTVEEDPMKMCKGAVLHLRPEGPTPLSKVALNLQGKGTYTLRPPVTPELEPIFEYHVTLVDQHGGVLHELGTASRPNRLVLITEEELLAAAEAEWYESWWFWTVVGGVVVAGAATGTYFALQPDSGNVDFDVHLR